ncbi:hypothetical protein SJ05684_a41030 (plasmid) [Sinorhizobium sojae CCBAU 05684]|uniref:Uncharacterized protein n=2 Tax=Sinorhizobium TaxID=28105 RepID=I3XGE9_SINF2|nr:hypothetical protein USDA257_p02400 [Sinorhizobium fredii USDA 257]ASY61325.1 hypothetical protein SS05631_a49420 [Sinorhizobium sp. CCBAU 05631]ASY67416.1 hypothetical protein SJ05684_a41030 [Sinorhizobium sojae CCBAU 05684]ASY74290.1 hypothetical protein SF83666_a47040 [Sinorhizobium fredii CCBAU 83666]AWI62133.1 hypothetical protein AB395_00004609 [Sinorhizobium fredii CCBAU 45436]AWM30063.1 hypothetical protein AOX55_00004629 [Sinorhizobium fredii CCBAU 25509]CCE98830.1 hypothetical pr
MPWSGLIHAWSIKIVYDSTGAAASLPLTVCEPTKVNVASG